MTQEELIVKLTLDDSSLTSGINKASDSIAGVADGATGKAGKLSSALGIAGKAAGIAAAAAGAAIVKVGKDSLEAYANYEQLVGGVDTLFKDSSSKVQEYAANAFNTAGISANNYMETVTSFSASLLQSVGNDTAQAAEIANMAIIDMADNANKMGTSMESIQNAYQGFAKQNYTMLDNLKLGYGGTKQEMERLLADAEKLTGLKYDISNLDDVYSAIHVIQTELGITGTTALEASTTIQGSTASMKSAWQNLLVGIADDNANFENLISNFVDSITTVLSNILPRVEVIMTGIGQLVEKMVPALLDMVPALIENVIPSLIDSAFNAVMAIVDCIIDNMPMFVEAGINALLKLAEGFADAIPEMVPQIVDVVVTIVTTILENLPLVIEVAVKIIEGLIEGLVKSIPSLIAAVPKIIIALVQAFAGLPAQFVELGKSILTGLGKGIASAVSSVIKTAKEACTKVLNTVKNFFGIKSPSKVFAGLGLNLIEGFAEGIEKNSNAVSAVEKLSKNVENSFNPKLNTSLDKINIDSRLTKLDTLSTSRNILSNVNEQNNTELIGAFAQMTKQVINAISNVDMTVQIGDDTIAQSAKRGAVSYQRRTGKTLFV